MICPDCLGKVSYTEDGFCLVCPKCGYRVTVYDPVALKAFFEVQTLYDESLRDGSCAYYNDRVESDNPYHGDFDSHGLTSEDIQYAGWREGFLSAKNKTEQDAEEIANIESQSGILDIIDMELEYFLASIEDVPFWGTKGFFTRNINDFTNKLKENLQKLPRIETK